MEDNDPRFRIISSPEDYLSEDRRVRVVVFGDGIHAMFSLSGTLEASIHCERADLAKIIEVLQQALRETEGVALETQPQA